MRKKKLMVANAVVAWKINQQEMIDGLFKTQSLHNIREWNTKHCHFHKNMGSWIWFFQNLWCLKALYSWKPHGNTLWSYKTSILGYNLLKGKKKNRPSVSTEEIYRLKQKLILLTLLLKWHCLLWSMWLGVNEKYFR